VCLRSSSHPQAELDRYLFYFQRYENHHQAGKFAERLRETTQKRMTELQEKSTSSWSDVTYLEAATEVLLDCRRVLKYSYAFGYYMKDSREKRLFEHLQEMLEKNTEHLAELTEMPLSKMDRTDVVNYTRVTQRFMNQLLEGIEEGLTAGPVDVK
jgi:ariadne-1